MAINSNYVRVRNKKTGTEVDMPPKTFEILKKQYDLISGQVQESTQKKTVKGAEPVVLERKILTPEEIAAKKAELQAMNQEAEDKVAAEAEKPARKKPGPKPKINA